MQSLSQRSIFHEQSKQQNAGGKKNPGRFNKGRLNWGRFRRLSPVGRFIASLIKPSAQRFYNNYSLSHLSEHQLRDIGFTRESSTNMTADVNLATHHYLHEQRRRQIRRLPKD